MGPLKKHVICSDPISADPISPFPGHAGSLRLPPRGRSPGPRPRAARAPRGRPGGVPQGVSTIMVKCMGFMSPLIETKVCCPDPV